jgi:hypothetical protein
MKHGDIIFGTVGTISTGILSTINIILAFIAGSLTVFVMVLRARREWKHRNLPPEE